MKFWSLNKNLLPDNQAVLFITKGGFGNQLFQIACGLNYSLKHELDVGFIHRDPKRKSCLDLFGIADSNFYSTSVSNGKLGLHWRQDRLKSNRDIWTKWNEAEFHFSQLPNTKFYEFNGYWQSYRYFDEFRDVILDYFKCLLVNEKSHSNSLTGVHIRLGDYLHNAHTHAYHGILRQEYYLEALNRLDNPEYFTVTDDHISLSEIYDKISSKSKFVYSGQLLDDFSSLVNSNGIIIGNSTFSWWAARLSDKTVVAPKQWFSKEVMKTVSTSDLFPSNWILL